MSDPKDQCEATLEAVVQAAREAGQRCVVGTLKRPHDQLAHNVEYVPNYGVICPYICTTNGNLAWLLNCLPEGTVFTPTEKP